MKHIIPFSLVDIVVDRVDHLPQLLVLTGRQGGGCQWWPRFCLSKIDQYIEEKKLALFWAMQYIIFIPRSKHFVVPFLTLTTYVHV